MTTQTQSLAFCYHKTILICFAQHKRKKMCVSSRLLHIGQLGCNVLCPSAHFASEYKHRLKENTICIEFCRAGKQLNTGNRHRFSMFNKVQEKKEEKKRTTEIMYGWLNFTFDCVFACSVWFFLLSISFPALPKYIRIDSYHVSSIRIFFSQLDFARWFVCFSLFSLFLLLLPPERFKALACTRLHLRMKVRNFT